MHRFFVEFTNIPGSGPLTPEASDWDLGDATMTALAKEMGGVWHLLGNEAACTDGSAVLTVELSLDAGANVGVIGAWVRPSAGRPWAFWVAPLIGILSGVSIAVLKTAAGLPTATVATIFAGGIVATGAVWTVARWRARLRFERERAAKREALHARVRMAITRAGGMLLLREEPDPT